MDSYKNKKIIITGGRGYIGSKLSNYFSFLDCTLVIIDNSNINWKPLGTVAKIIYKKIDLTNVQEINTSDIFDNSDYIFHFASKDLDNNRNVEEDLKMNTLSTFYLLDKCKNIATNSKIIFASAAMIYGHVDKIPVNETTPNSPPSLWSTSKLFSENYLKFFSNKYNLKCISIRIPNIYGETGRDNIFLRMTINKILFNVYDKNTLNLYDNLDLDRDFIFIDDVINAFVSISNLKEELFNGNYYVIGSNEKSSYRELSNKINKLRNNSLTIVHNKNTDIDYHEMRKYFADTSKYQLATNWSPNTSLFDGLKKTLNYIEANHKKFK
jgi:UDP-glucose 4-epimerase